MKKKNNFKIGYALNSTYEIICGFSRSLLHEYFFKIIQRTKNRIQFA